MIRKILLLIIVVLVSIWFAGAHIIKNRLILIVEENNSDNIKFSYQDTKISGFPFNWQVSFVSPQVTIVDQQSLRDISIPILNMKFNYFMQDLSLDLGKVIYCSDARDDLVQEYKLSSEENIIFNTHFKEPVYFIDSALQWKNFVSSASLSLPLIKTHLLDKEIFTVSDIQVDFSQKLEEVPSNMHFKLTGKYNSFDNDLAANKAYLLLDLSYLINNQIIDAEDKLNFDRRLKITKIKLRLDDSSLDIDGDLQLARNSLPQGEVNVSLVQYKDIINNLIPEDFIFSPAYIKKIIAKATFIDMNSDSNNADFKISFSNQGITIGKFNLLELKAE